MITLDYHPSTSDPSYDPFFTGMVSHAYQDRKRRWRTAYFENGSYMGGTVRTDAEWAALKWNHCKICQPSGVPPFYDCPHGHYLTPSRIEEQIRWMWISEFGFYTGVWVISTMSAAVGIFAFFVVTGLYGLFVLAFLADLHTKRATIRLLSRGGPWAENPSVFWEKRDRRNEPWLGRVF